MSVCLCPGLSLVIHAHLTWSGGELIIMIYEKEYINVELYSTRICCTALYELNHQFELHKIL